MLLGGVAVTLATVAGDQKVKGPMACYFMDSYI